jgi:hypothetical protein
MVWSISLEEFFKSIEGSAAVGNWQDADKVQVAVLKLTDAARQFYDGCLDLHSADTTWSKFKSTFRHRIRDVHTDQYHFMNLQTARQGRNETLQEFADRCRALSQKIVCKVEDPLAQAIHYQNAERMLLANFISGLAGEPGRQVKYANPSTMEQALRIALSVDEAQKQGRFNETFYAKFENSVRLQSPSPSRSRHDERKPRHSADVKREVNDTLAQQYNALRKSDKPTTSNTRSTQTKAALRCYECEGVGRFARECPTRLKREENSTNSPGRRNSSERSRRSRSPEHKPSHSTRKAVKKKRKHQES